MKKIRNPLKVSYGEEVSDRANKQINRVFDWVIGRIIEKTYHNPQDFASKFKAKHQHKSSKDFQTWLSQ